MIFAKLRYNNENHVLTFNDIIEYNRATWSPSIQTLEIYELKIYGKTYKDKKNYLQDLAINLQILLNDMSIDWYTYGIICDFFSRNAEKYGLIKEFRENGLI